MEQARKNLKSSSIIVLALAGLSLLNMLFEIFFGELNQELSGATIPEGSPNNIVLIAKIVVLVISVLMLLPQVYIGIKGLKMAKKPDASSAHIVWGIILIVFTVLALVTPFVAFVKGEGEAFGNASEFLSIAVDAVILYEYVKYARIVRNGIEQV